MVYPLIFEPIYKSRIWGGNKLRTALGKDIPAGEPIGESWEIADLPHEQSVVAVDPAKGKSLGTLIQEWGRELTGRAPLFAGSFPLLIKFLDAQQDLSVQVHPDKAMAKKLGGDVRVKHEAWYVLDAQPGAVIYKGLKSGVTREDFAVAISQGTCAQLLQKIPVRVGDCHYLPSGTVHALGAGVLVAEVQTPSDVTYRVFDWNRIDPQTGRSRELHIEQALECIHFGPVNESAQQRSHVGSYWTTVTRLVTCESFIIEKVRMVAGLEQNIPYAEMVVWIILSGGGEIIYDNGRGRVGFKLGDVVLLPAALRDARVALKEDSTWLEVTIPTESDLAEFDRPSSDDLREIPAAPYVSINIQRG